MSSLDEQIARIARPQFSLFTVDQARGAGFTRAMIRHRRRTGRWTMLEPNVFVVNGAPITWDTAMMALCLSTGGLTSHRTATALYDVEGFRLGRREITVDRPVKDLHPDAIVHSSTQFALAEIDHVRGIPVTAPARLAVDLGAVVPYERYEQAAVALIGKELLTWEGIAAAVITHSRQGRNGIGPARQLLLERGGDKIAGSALERLFDKLRRHHGLPAPEIEYSIYDAQGFIARVDCAYPAHKIVIELNSKEFHLRPSVAELDGRKRNRLEIEGWRVLVFTWERLIREPAAVAREVRAALRMGSVLVGRVVTQ